MKILLCLALHLYHGPIDAADTQVTTLAEDCKAVALEKARKAMQQCAKQGAMKCEVIVTKEKITLETKLEIK